VNGLQGLLNAVLFIFPFENNFKAVEKESCLITWGYKALQLTPLFSFFSPLLNFIIEPYQIKHDLTGGNYGS
jgi:hypothetical protein